MNQIDNLAGRVGKPTATYLRVSTSAQEDQQTIGTQRMSVKEYAVKKGLNLIQEYADDGWSGDSLIRPKLDQLRQDAKAKIWNTVLIYDPDRLARRYSYQELVMDELREAGIEVLFVTIPPAVNDEDRIMYGMRGLFSQYERMKIAERFRLGKLRKVKEDHILTTEASYGHDYIRNNKETREHGYYVINEEEAKVVNMICRWIDVENLTLKRVVKRLQELGIRPRKNKNGVWNTSTLSTLLRNKALIGEAHYGASVAIVPVKPFKNEKYRKMKKTSRRIKPESEWIKITVPPIVDKALFIRVQEKLKRNALLSQRNKKNNYLLSGKIHCSCGRTRCGEGPQHGKYLYYRCTDRILCFPLPQTCGEKGVNARIADELFWSEIVEFMSSPKLMMQQVSRWMNKSKMCGKFSLIDIEGIEKEIGKLKETEDRYSKAFGSGLFTIEKLKEYLDPLRERISLLEKQISEAQQEKMETEILALPNQEEMETFAQKARELLKDLSFEAKQEIVRSVIGKLVSNQKQMDVQGVLNLDEINVLFSNVESNSQINHVKFKTIYRNCRTTKRRKIDAI